MNNISADISYGGYTPFPLKADEIRVVDMFTQNPITKETDVKGKDVLTHTLVETENGYNWRINDPKTNENLIHINYPFHLRQKAVKEFKNAYSTNKYAEGGGIFGLGSDMMSKANVDAFYPNPLYRRTKPKNLFDMKPVVVGRLDGPSYPLARGLIDHAITAEEEGIAGRAYVDITGPHTEGDKWLESVAETFEENDSPI